MNFGKLIYGMKYREFSFDNGTEGFIYSNADFAGSRGIGMFVFVGAAVTSGQKKQSECNLPLLT